MASADGANPPVSAEEKLQLLKKAYRALKHETERRDEAVMAERVSHQRERGILMNRIEEIQNELRELKDAVCVVASA